MALARSGPRKVACSPVAGIRGSGYDNADLNWRNVSVDVVGSLQLVLMLDMYIFVDQLQQFLAQRSYLTELSWRYELDLHKDQNHCGQVAGKSSALSINI